MSYHLAYHPRHALDYLDNHPSLTDQDCDRILEVAEEYIGRGGDTYRNNPALRVSPGSACFLVEILFRCDRPRLFRFVVNDAQAAGQRLFVEYIDEIT